MHRLALPALLVLTVGFTAAPARAQMDSRPPIVVKQSPPKVKILRLRAEVIHFDSRSITVQEQGNSLYVHTFTFAPGIQDKMQKVSDAGGYQYGDQVEIRYADGGNVALEIKGKPSRPL